MMKQLFLLFAVVFAVQAKADNYRDMDPLTLETPEMKAELVDLPERSPILLDMATPSVNPKMDFDFFKSKTNPDVKPYKFMDDMTFVGIPLFVAGWALKGDKAMFRVNAKADQGGKKNTQLLTDFKTGIDDYTQFFGPAMVVGLKLGGYEGRSDWPRLLASAGMSYLIMAGLVNGIKYSAKEMRPDGSTANSWPSGHTATAFVGASLLHKEYGLTRSPWWSVAGYGIATATGVMRVLNNRHWISDVMSGAGIGIMSTELGYALCDLMFKQKGLLRNDLILENEKPSFFSISMGVGLGGKDLEFESDGEKRTITFRAATVVDAEGAYFFNKYIGVGGRLRIRAQSTKDFGDFTDYAALEDMFAWEGLRVAYQTFRPEDYIAGRDDQNFFTYFEKVGYDMNSEESWRNANSPVTDIYGIVKSDHITEFTGSVGVYFNLPLSSHFSLGTKALIGRSITQELDIDGHAEGNLNDISYMMELDNRPGNKQPDGDPTLSISNLEYPSNMGEKWTDDWEYLTIGAKSSTSFGTGISLTYKYKSNFSWRLFCDYDYTRKDFTATYDPFHFMQKGITTGAYVLMETLGDYGDEQGLEVREFRTRKNMNYVTLGLSFMVNF
jgi:membrane-associated phospholipid phosphatase